MRPAGRPDGYCPGLAGAGKAWRFAGGGQRSIALESLESLNSPERKRSKDITQSVT